MINSWTLERASSTMVSVSASILSVGFGLGHPTPGSIAYPPHEVHSQLELASPTKGAIAAPDLAQVIWSTQGADTALAHAVTRLYAKLMTEQESLGGEFENILFDNLWDLYSRS